MLTTRPVLRGRDDQIGLPREKRRDLQHVGDRRHGRGLSGLVDVGQDRARRRASLTRPSTRSPSSRPGPRNEVSDVRLALSYDALKMYGTPHRAAMALIARASSIACRFALDDAGSGYEDERAAAADGHRPDGHGWHGSDHT